MNEGCATVLSHTMLTAQTEHQCTHKYRVWRRNERDGIVAGAENEAQADDETLPLEAGSRQLSIGPTSWWPRLEGGGPNVLWQGWSGSVMPPLAARTGRGTAYTVRIKPTICPDVAVGCV